LQDEVALTADGTAERACDFQKMRLDCVKVFEQDSESDRPETTSQFLWQATPPSLSGWEFCTARQ